MVPLNLKCLNAQGILLNLIKVFMIHSYKAIIAFLQLSTLTKSESDASSTCNWGLIFRAPKRKWDVLNALQWSMHYTLLFKTERFQHYTYLKSNVRRLKWLMYHVHQPICLDMQLLEVAV